MHQFNMSVFFGGTQVSEETKILLHKKSKDIAFGPNQEQL